MMFLILLLLVGCGPVVSAPPPAPAYADIPLPEGATSPHIVKEKKAEPETKTEVEKLDHLEGQLDWAKKRLGDKK